MPRISKELQELKYNTQIRNKDFINLSFTPKNDIEKK